MRAGGFEAGDAPVSQSGGFLLSKAVSLLPRNIPGEEKRYSRLVSPDWLQEEKKEIMLLHKIVLK
jgi:hypothetical protein